MRKSDIVIYEKDSVDVTFELEGTNELITNFEADDKIVFALRMFNSGPAILLKEKTGVTGRQVTFSLDKHDTFRLRPQRYVYDIAVLRGDDHQTTVCKSAYFTVTDKQVPIKDSAIITLDTLAQYNLLKSEMQSFYTTTRKHSRDAEDFANAALEAKTSVEQTVSSAQAEINQKVQTVQQAEQNVQSLTNNATERIGEALSTLERETTESVNAVKQAEGNAKASAEQAIEASRRAKESEINAKDSEDVATLAKISAKESSDAAHRYANDVHDIYDEVQKSTEDLIEAANKAEPLLKEMQDVAEELTEAAKETTANIALANQAVADSQSYANQAQASATSASTSASTATTQADRATTQATNAATQANNAKASADSAKTQATNASTSVTLAQGYANNASASATNASTSATNASNSAKSAQDFATNAGANASAVASQVAIAQTAAENALDYKNDAYDYKESAKTYAEQANAVKAELADVAYSGSYNDLSNKPTIPTVPTNVSSFNNDSGYLTEHQDVSGKADKSTTYTKTETDGLLNAKANQSTTYTKTETDGLLNAKANQSTTYTKTEVDSIASGKLSLSGGALTGSEIRRNVDNANIVIRGCTANAKGSRLVMYGQDTTDYAGEFDLQAFKASVGSPSLHGRPNGTLAWNNNDLAGSAIVSSGTNYIRYASGLQICWGSAKETVTCGTPSGQLYRCDNANGVLQFVFPQAFKSVPTIQSTYVGVNWAIVGPTYAGTNDVRCILYRTVNGTAEFEVAYVAVGKWK